jgi:DNA replication and repair protein RecF
LRRRVKDDVLGAAFIRAQSVSPGTRLVAPMYVTRLEVNDLRIIETASLTPGLGANLIVGANGSGKTSLLEAIHLLCTGRSFRSRRAQEYVRRGASEARVHARITQENGENVAVGIEKRARSTRIRFAEAELRSASALARRLPLVLIPPDCQRLVFDGADLRRRLMDWGLFHVEQEYATVHHNYRRVLQQRNAQLRALPDADALAPWDAELGEMGEKLDGLRQIHLKNILPRISALATQLSGLEVSVHYIRGWDEQVRLCEALAAGLNRDAGRGYTGIGPHRADLDLRVNGAPALQVLSRGEAKLICFALWLAQVKDHQFQNGRTPVVLIDDLAAELDPDNRRRVFGTLLELGVQSFVTSLDEELTQDLGGPWKGFHVERGKVEEMV